MRKISGLIRTLAGIAIASCGGGGMAVLARLHPRLLRRPTACAAALLHDGSNSLL